MPRYFDPRVGYVTESFEKYDDPKTWVMRRQFIARQLSRLLDAEVLAPDKAYTAMELAADLQAGIWSELNAEHPCK